MTFLSRSRKYGYETLHDRSMNGGSTVVGVWEGKRGRGGGIKSSIGKVYISRNNYHM